MTVAELANVVGGFSTGAAALIGIIAVAFGYLQVNLSNRLAAHDAYCELLKVMIELPHYSPPKYDNISADSAAYNQYKRYIAYLLTVCERLLIANKEESYWTDTIGYYIRLNGDHLKSDDFTKNHLQHYCRPLQDLIARNLSVQPAIDLRSHSDCASPAHEHNTHDSQREA